MTLPPEETTTEDTTTTDVTTTEVETTTQDTTVAPLPPVGDCPCGGGIDSMEIKQPSWEQERILSQDPEGTGNLVRPWMVKIIVPAPGEAGDGTEECSGSLLNR